MSHPSWRSSNYRNNDSSDKLLFRVRNRSSQCDKNDIEISPVQIVGYFSVDGNRTYLPNSSNLSYYKPPKTENVCFDLNHGIEKVRRKPPSADDEKINHLLKWIKMNLTKVQALDDTEKWIQPNFVCFRGLLTVILCTPYLSREPWIICAAKWKNTIYLCAYKSLQDKERNRNLSQDNLRFMSWGFKFETFIFADAPDKQPDVGKPVDESEEFCCMFQRRIGAHRLLYGAEMDGILTEEKLEDPLPLEKLKFIEAKTSKVIMHDGQERNFCKFKLLKWWAQSYLVGIDEILCGFRDDGGIVRNVKTYSLPEIIEKSKFYWDPKVCLNFCEAFLTHISKTVVNDCNKTIYKFERIPNGDIITTTASPTSEYAFMDTSYFNRNE